MRHEIISQLASVEVDALDLCSLQAALRPNCSGPRTAEDLKVSDAASSTATQLEISHDFSRMLDEVLSLLVRRLLAEQIGAIPLGEER